MKQYILLTMLVLGFGVVGAQNTVTAKPETGTLLVLVKGFKNTEGQLMVALYNNQAEFLSKNPFKGTATPISANEELIRFENIPYGDYAVGVIHDMNNNGELDKNFLGIPTEGYGFSNNAMGAEGPPSFLQASFVFAGRDEAKVIDLEYGIPKK